MKNERAIGEASASYLWDVQSPKMIHEVVPNAHIVIILRDPIDRAFSHYLMSIRQREELSPFYDAIVKDYNRSDKGYFHSHLYVDLGLYSKQVRRYLDAFGHNNVKILIFEEFVKDTEASVNEVLRFLGLEPYVPSNIGKVYDPYVNPTNHTKTVSLLSKIAFDSGTAGSARKFLKRAGRTLIRNSASAARKEALTQRLLQATRRSSIPEDGREYLKKIYRDDVEELKTLLGRSLIPWANFME